MIKALLALPFVAFALSAAAPVATAPATTPVPPAKVASILPPPEVVANPANKLAIAADAANRLNIELSSGGTVVIQLRPDAAPAHVERIQTLVRRGFYNGLTFHRVIPGFMAQGGDPKGNGSGETASAVKA
mgnify:CR=1 FL=1